MLRHAFLLGLVGCGGTIASSGDIQSITLHSTGGFIGEDMTYALAPDGSVVTTGHGVDPTGTTHAAGGTSDASSLFSNVQATNVLGVGTGKHLPTDTCCDRIEDDLVIVTKTGTFEWAIMADGQGAPNEVLSALQLVHAYIRAAH